MPKLSVKETASPPLFSAAVRAQDVDAGRAIKGLKRREVFDDHAILARGERDVGESEGHTGGELIVVDIERRGAGVFHFDEFIILRDRRVVHQLGDAQRTDAEGVKLGDKPAPDTVSQRTSFDLRGGGERKRRGVCQRGGADRPAGEARVAAVGGVINRAGIGIVVGAA